MNKGLACQVATPAAQHHGAEVCGIRFGDSAEVEVMGTAERMTIEEFARRYPAG